MGEQELEIELVVPGDIISLTTVQKLLDNLGLVTKITRGMILLSELSKGSNLKSSIRRGF